MYVTRPGSNPRPLACEANPLRHSGEGLGSQKYLMYTWHMSNTKAGIVENDSCNQETTGNFEPDFASKLEARPEVDNKRGSASDSEKRKL